MYIQNVIRKIFLEFYFLFNKKFLFKDGYELSYYIYKNTRPRDTFKNGVRTDDTTVLYVIDKILTSDELTNTSSINCFDVGGYIGVITLLMSKKLRNQKKNWKIHTFEPFNESFLKLQENIKLDPFNHKINLNNVAVSNESGSAILETYKEKPGENQLYFRNSKKSANKRNENVKVITLKDYIYDNGIKNINVCKIDTEGSDYFVVKGLSKYLNNKIVDFFIFEYQEDNYDKIYDLLNLNGYKIFYLVRNEDILVSSLKNYPKICKSLLNYIAVSPDKINNFIKKFNLDELN